MARILSTLTVAIADDHTWQIFDSVTGDQRASGHFETDEYNPVIDKNIAFDNEDLPLLLVEAAFNGEI